MQIVTVCGCQIVSVDQTATNGVLHEISDVMITPEVNIATRIERKKDTKITNKVLMAASLKHLLDGKYEN